MDTSDSFMTSDGQDYTSRNASGVKYLEGLMPSVQKQLYDSLTKMLDGADDKLFDMADKTTNEEEQKRFFTAMRELRLNRKKLEETYRSGISESFAALYNEKQQQSEDNKQSHDVDFENLSLVNEDELEIDLTIDNMARRIRSLCSKELEALSFRIEHILQAIDFEKGKHPFNPRTLIALFSDELSQYELDMQAHLVLMKIYERSLIVAFPAMVKDINQQLAGQGILPDIDQVKAKRRADARQQPRKVATQPPVDNSESPDYNGSSDYNKAASAGENIAAQADSSQLFGMLQELLGARGDSMQAGAIPVTEVSPEAGIPNEGVTGQLPQDATGLAILREGIPHVNGMPVQTDAPVQALTSDDLVTLLDRMQRLEESLERSTEGQVSDFRADLTEMIDDQVTDEGAMPALNHADDDAINLITMLFNYIHEDPSLTSEIKAQIGRLQIPLLKVAIADNDFFADDKHPARLLLNKLAELGAQWSPSQGVEDAIYDHIARVVGRVIDDFQRDTALFTELFDETERFHVAQKAHIERLESRIRQIEEGKARSEAAKSAVDELLKTYLHDQKLDKAASRLIDQVWRKVLQLTHLKEGEESGSWRQRKNLLKNLVWSLRSGKSAKELERLKQTAPKLLTGFKVGLQFAGFDSHEKSKLIRFLESQYALQYKQESTPDKTPEQTPADSSRETDISSNDQKERPAAREQLQVDPIVEKDESGSTEKSAAKNDAAIKDAQQETYPVQQVTQSQPIEENQQESNKAVDVGKPVDEVEKEDAQPVQTIFEDDHPLVIQLGQLPTGQWVEFVSSDNPDDHQRCRLAANIRQGKKLVFINRRGVKVFEFSAGQLAPLLESGAARIIEDTRLFDRALEAMITDLRQMQQHK